ncbi:MAG: hypothetical protein MJ211_01890 [Bacteroidales bacterium]|nr:hypothetical protein [Bacteroidales bacterium]
MKRIITLLFIITSLNSFAIDNINSNFSKNTDKKLSNIDSLWLMEDSLIQKGLFYKASEKILEIRTIAKSEQNFPEILKTYLINLDIHKKLDNYNISNEIEEIENEIKKSPTELKAFLNSILASIYYDTFYNNNEFLLNKKQIEILNNKNIITKILNLYDKSIENKNELAKISIYKYKDILTNYDSEIYNNFSVYDFLCFRAINDFYLKIFNKNDICLSNQENEILLSNYNNFISDTYNNNSIFYKIIDISKNIINSHKNDNDKNLLAIFDLQRLKFIYQNSEIKNKDSLYINSLSFLSQQLNSKDSLKTNIEFEIASIYNKLSRKIEYSESQKTEYFNKAKNIYTNIIETNNNKEIIEKSKNELNKITNPYLEFSIDEVVIPYKPYLITIRYKNTTKIYQIILDLNNNIIKDLENKSKENQLSLILENSREISNKEILNNINNFKITNYHEIKSIDLTNSELPNGYYAIIFSNYSNLKDYKNNKDQVIAFETIQVTNITASIFMDENNQLKIIPKNRTTGENLINAEIELNSGIEDPITKEIKYTSSKPKKSNNEEILTFKIDKNVKKYYFKITYKDDYIYTDKMYLNKNEHDEFQNILITNKEIYQPGDKVYYSNFKFSEKDEEKYILHTGVNKNFTIQVINPQGQIISILNNSDYSNFNNPYNIPRYILPGKYILKTVETGYCDTIIIDKKIDNVFETKFIKPNTEISENSPIIIKGISNYYSTGLALIGANVKYTINQILSNNQQKTIYNGFTKTNQNGEFEIKFNPNKSENKATNYIITTYITSKLGETETKTTEITKYPNSLIINCNINGDVFTNEYNWWKNIIISVTNNLGEPINKTVNCKLIKLYNFNKPKFSTKWPRGIYPINRINFEKTISSIAYTDEETELNNLSKEKTALNFTINTENYSPIMLKQLENIVPSNWLLELSTQNENGDTIKCVKYFSLIKYGDKSFDLNRTFWNNTQKENIIQRIIYGSSISNLNIDKYIYNNEKYVEKSCEKILKYNSYQFNKQKYNEKVYFNLTAIKDNQVIKLNKVLQFPINTESNLNINNIREKNYPGQNIEIKMDNFDKENDQMITIIQNSNSELNNKINQKFEHLYNKITKPTDFNFCKMGFKNSNFISNFINKETKTKNNTIDINWFVQKSLYKENDLPRNQKRSDDFVINSISDSLSITRPSRSEIENISEEEIEPEDDEYGFDEVAIRSKLNNISILERNNPTIKLSTNEKISNYNLTSIVFNNNLEYSILNKQFKTIKNFIVETNLPKTLRIGDSIYIPVKVSNLQEDTKIEGNVKIEIYDSKNQKKLEQFKFDKNIIDFNIDEHTNKVVYFKTKVPNCKGSILVNITGVCDNGTDGEQHRIRILPNKSSVLHITPITADEKSVKNINIDKLKNKENIKLSLEFSANPIWNALSALPNTGLKENETILQQFGKIYSNIIAKQIVEKNNEIENILTSWTTIDTTILTSNLEKNRLFKRIFLQETPWLADAEIENKQRQNIKNLNNFSQLEEENNKIINKLMSTQNNNGSWSINNSESITATTKIIEGLGKLNYLKALNINNELLKTITKAIYYLDKKYISSYKNNVIPNSNAIDYLFARQYFTNISLSPENKEIYDKCIDKISKNWFKYSTLQQAQIANILLTDNNKKNIAIDILKSLKANSIIDKENGMYFSNLGENSSLETQSIVIETFNTFLASKLNLEKIVDTSDIEKMKIWMIKNKQTNIWKNPKLSADVCYDLFYLGKKEKSEYIPCNIKIGKLNIIISEVQSGTGYVQNVWNKDQIKPDMKDIKIINPNNHKTFGNIYLQYLENNDSIKEYSNDIKLRRIVFLNTIDNEGNTILKQVDKNTKIKIGDKVTVRFLISSNKDLSYLHLRDSYASGLISDNKLSEMKEQNGIKYYQSSKNTSENFFIRNFTKGTQIIEYTLTATHAGNFTNGIATIQSLYSPDIYGNSESGRITIIE